MGAVCLGQTDETDALREAWEELLFCQFHDTLAGTASVHGYGSIRSKLGFVEAVADRVATKGLQGLARSIDTSLERPVERESSFWDGSEGVGIPFLVYNPLPWRVRGPVVASRSADDVVDSAGRELEHQAVASGEVTLFRSHTLWLADLEPLGYEVYWLREGRLRAASEVAQVPRIERGRFRVELDTDTGTLSHIVDRETGMNLVARQGIQLVAVDDPTDTWSHGTVRYGDEGPALTLTGWEVVEDGPVRSTLRLRFRGAGSVIRLDVAVYEDLDFVEIVVDADWQAVQTALKLSCAWSLDDAAATVAGAPYSFAERAASTGEEPMQSWLDVADERRGVLVTTSHPHGYDATGPNVRLTLLRNPLAADHGFGWAERPGEDFPATDSGRHTITLRFHPHHGDWRTVRANHQALLHQQPPTVLATSYHAGGRAQRGTFLSIEPEGSALVTAVKRFEDGGGTVFRLWEPYGSAVSGCLRGELVGRDAGFTLAPYEVQTLLVPDDLALPSRALMLTEFELPIDGDDSTG
jgi:alpha-mannosidase